MFCCQLRTDNKGHRAAELKMLAVTSDKLITKKASYNASCYKDYTAIYYKKRKREKSYGTGKSTQFCI